MRKFLIAAVLTAPVLWGTSCQKQQAEMSPSPAAQHATPDVKSNAKWLKKVMDFMGVRVTMTYMSGCYHGRYEHHANGSTIVDVTCNPGCEVCQGKIVLGGSPRVGTDGNGNTSVLGYTEAISNQSWGGFAGISNDGNDLILGVDQTLMTSTTYNELFAGDVLTLDNGFCLNQGVADYLGLTTGQMLVPAGSYELNLDGNVIWWTVPIASLRSPL